MSEVGKVRLVRCPKCENLLTELPDYSVYQCGGCGTVLRAKDKDAEVDMLSENLDEERVGGLLEKFPEASENIELAEKAVVNLSDGSGNDVRSNGSSTSGLKSKEIMADRVEIYRNNSRIKGDKKVVKIEEDMNEEANGTGKEPGDLNPWIGNASWSRSSARISDWRTGERTEMEQFRSNQRVDVAGLRYSTSNYSGDVPSSYQFGSNYDNAERMKNRIDFDELKKVEYLEQDRTELLRKLDELKDQLSRTKMVEDPKEKASTNTKVGQQDPYGVSDNWFSDGRPGQKRVSMQYSVSDKHVAGPSYISQYGEPPLLMNSHEMAMHSFYAPMHTPNQLHGFEDPFRSQMLQRHMNQAPHPSQQQRAQQYIPGPGRYVNNDMVNFDILEPYLLNINRHPSSCSCVHCYNKYSHPLQPVPPSVSRDKTFVENNPMFYHRENPGGQPDYNPRFALRDSHNPYSRTRLADDLNFEASVNRQRHRRVVLATGGSRCLPVAGGAPFVACNNCFELLQLPKNLFQTKKILKKLRCVACSKIILLVVSNNKLVLSLSDGVKKTLDDSCNMVAKTDSSNYQKNVNWGSMDLSSDEYENTGYDFHSMDQKLVSSTVGQNLSSNRSADMRSSHSTISCTSGDEENPNTLSSTRKETNSDELMVETGPSRPPSGSPLQDHFDYSRKYNMVSRVGKGNRSGRSEHQKVITKKVASRQNSMKDVAVATELDISSNEYANTGLSLDSGDVSIEQDQLRVKKGGTSFFAGIIMKSFKDKSRSGVEQEKSNVAVNGHPIPDRLIKKAEKLAGPIQPGQYWYDSRAGFWGVMGGPCLGIIPPFIEEFSYAIPEDCAGGNTGVYVNGRELNQKDLILLGNRGLPTERDRSYIIEMTGRVLDEDSGEELDSLGKLAPTVEKVKHGFGMKPPRTAA